MFPARLQACRRGRWPRSSPGGGRGQRPRLQLHRNV